MNKENNNDKCLYCKFSIVTVDGIRCNVLNKFVKKDDTCEKWRYKF